MRISEIATALGAELEGGSDPEITGIAPLDRAGPTELSFVAQARYLTYLDATRAAAVLVAAPLAERTRRDLPRIVVPDVHRALTVLLPRLYPPVVLPADVHETVVLGAGVQLGEGVRIEPYAVIGAGTRVAAGCRIGAHCVVGAGCALAEEVVLHPQVTLYPGVSVGARSILHSGVRIGVDGFGYAYGEGGHQKIPQVGRCVIGADVEIGANTTIDRGSVGATEIGDGVKIDNLVHIGHNVRIGEHSVIVAQVGIAGSTTVGRGVTLAGQVGIPGHLKIGDGATVAAQAGVFGDVPPGAVYSGYPARPHKESLKAQAALFRLPELVRRIRAMERSQGRETPEE